MVLNLRTRKPGMSGRVALDSASLHQGLLLSAIAAGTVAGILGSSVVPLLLGIAIDGFRLSKLQGGVIGVVEAGAAPIVALALAPLVHRVPLRSVAIGGMIVSIAAEFLSNFAAGFSELLLLRTVAGAGLGGAFAAANSVAASMRNPSKVYGIALAAALFIIGLVTALLGAAAQRYGYRGAYAVLGVFLLGMLPFVSFLKYADPTQEEIHAGSAPNDYSGATVLFICVILFNLGTSPIYSFVERIGRQLEIPEDTVAVYLGISTIAGAVGALIPMWIPRQVATSRSVSIAFLLCAMSCLLIGYSASGAMYALAASLYWVTYCYLYVALLAVGGAADPSGRVSAALGGLNVVTYSLGPAIGGMIGEWSTYLTIAWGCFGCCILGAVVFRMRFRTISPA
jgi:predicted MFS family arabinose efflux permease